ncbi:MAG: L-aspartate oxidase [Phycisphaerales bacterium]|nr:L-aspartate oxidase [Phycisphaerales bacterium]
MNTDFLIIGTGVAGLSLALKLSKEYPHKQITILTKSFKDDNNTQYAQGGIAVVMDLVQDSSRKHIQDTLIAGDELCDEVIVKKVVNQGAIAVRELIQYGAHFDRKSNIKEDYDYAKEGGHSEKRIVHFKDITGKHVMDVLLKQVKQRKNIVVLERYFVIDLITQHHLGYLMTKSSPNITCYGVYALNSDNNIIEKIVAPLTFIATGGCGQVYKATTNPAVATGDGIAMTYRAKGRIANMEFIQFHPTVLWEANDTGGQNFLITEAARGLGGLLFNHQGVRFMIKYDKRHELAPRDIVARAIDEQMKIEGKDHVFLDCTKIAKADSMKHFPNIIQKCQSLGINFFKDRIPVTPAAHYCCGGIKTDEYGRTSIENLYALGEAASTGLHGANRLASNSLLEGLVFADFIFQHVSSSVFVSTKEVSKRIPNWNMKGTTKPHELVLITQSLKEIKQIMSDYVGIVRTNQRLQRAMMRIDLLHEETEQLYRNSIISPQLCELRNLITVGYLIVKSSLFRKESRGLHFNTDYPLKSKIKQDIVL